jgi:centromeric protein E
MDADILNGEGSARTAIQVVVRLRPLIARELRNGSAIAWKWNERTVELRDDAVVEQSYAAAQGRQTHSFTFDRVFAPAALTRALYDAALVDTVTSVMDGFHASVFCYGQTSSGKTHTVQGSDGIDHLASRGRQLDAGVGIDAAWDAGLIELSLRSIFDYIASHQEREFLLRVSYLEVYNEKIFDLLHAGDGGGELDIREDKQRGVFVAGASEVLATSRDDVFAMLRRGGRARAVGETDMNARSSRSHTIFRATIEQVVTEVDASSSAGASDGGG